MLRVGFFCATVAAHPSLLFKKRLIIALLLPLLCHNLPPSFPPSQALNVVWLLLTGGAKVWHMTATTLSGAMGSVVQTGLDCGDIEYHAIIARKPRQA